MTIPLSTLLSLKNLDRYKLHLACWNGDVQPLDVFVRNKSEWDDWNRWRSAKDEFNRDYVIAFADFYHEPHVWLFGGIYRVTGREAVNFSHSYTVERSEEHADLIGRLKVHLPRPARGRSFRLENYYQNMSVSEILREPYTGERFPGYESITCDFPELEAIFRAVRPDWKAALESVKGVYLIVDQSNGKKYVGSAYGTWGIWARWRCYVQTGHGWNDELTKLIAEEGMDYARRNFRISLLEYRPARTDDNVIIARESFWKEAVLSRVPLGYNKN